MLDNQLEKLSLEELVRLDAVCDALTESWSRGERPQLEDMIATVPDSLRQLFTLELVQHEIECRRNAGEQPTPGEYAARFPEWAEELVTRIGDLPQTAGSSLDLTQQVAAAGRLRTPSHRNADSIDSPTEPMHILARDLPVPAELLSHYQLRGVIGKGGMGIVVRARDVRLDRDVAIKFLTPELSRSDVARQRFLREARAAAAVRHDNVVTIYSVREVDNVPLLEMELVQGESLAERIQRSGAIPPLEVARLAIQIARGLDAAHKRGLIHRDIKPGNILLESAEPGVSGNDETSGENSCRVKITDFGLARVVSEVTLTNSGLIAGTPQFMSPEQAEGKPIDHRSDLFSLGSVMYAMCSGRSPFRAESAVAILRQVSDFPPSPLRECHTTVPEWMSTIIDRLMEKKPENRFQSAGEVADALSRQQLVMRNPRTDSVKSDSTANLVTRSTPLRHLKSRVLQFVLALLPVIIFSAVMIIRTSKGEFILTTDDPEIAARITEAGGLMVENRETNTSYTLMPGSNRLPNGDYELHVTAPDGLSLKTSRFQLRRFGGSVSTTVTLREVINDDGKPASDSQSHGTMPVLSGSWSEPRPVEFGDGDSSGGNSCVSGDGLRIVFVSRRGGVHNRLFEAKRDVRTASFGIPEPVTLYAMESGAEMIPDRLGTPWLSADGLDLLFYAAVEQQTSAADIWRTHRDSVDSPWHPAELISGDVNSEADDYAPCLSADGKTIFWFRPDPQDRFNGDLWTSSRLDMTSEFSGAQRLQDLLNTAESEQHPFVSGDTRFLVFDRGTPNPRLWISERDTETQEFGMPAPISLPGSWPQRNAYAPSMTFDGQQLYFTSNSIEGKEGFETGSLWFTEQESTEGEGSR